MQLAREVLDIAAMMVKPGITTEEIDHAVHLVWQQKRDFLLLSHTKTETWKTISRFQVMLEMKREGEAAKTFPQLPGESAAAS